MRNEILNRAAANAAADNLEARAVRQCGQPGRRSELADRETSGIEFGGDFRAAEDNAQGQIDAFVAKKTLS